MIGEFNERDYLEGEIAKIRERIEQIDRIISDISDRHERKHGTGKYFSEYSPPKLDPFQLMREFDEATAAYDLEESVLKRKLESLQRKLNTL